MALDPRHPCRSLRDQHVVVTGGSTGIGLALARQAAEAGARVSLIARDPAKLGRARDGIVAAVPTAQPFTVSADVADREAVVAAVRAAEAAQGPTDVLITSAGIARPGYFEELPADVHERTMAVNFFGSLYPVRAVVPGMKARGHGAVVLISSGAGLYGFFGYTAYAPSKFALRGFAESLRAELQGTGVHVSIVYPPDTDTPQLAEEALTCPPETKAVTAAGGLWTADAVARVTLAGLARRRFAIAPGLPVAALLWWHSLLAPILHWAFDRKVRGARKQRPRTRDEGPETSA